MSQANKRRRRESIRMFKSDYLEWFSHIHPVSPILFWGPVISFLVWRSFAVHELDIWSVLGAAFAGLFVWSLTEYLLHRYLFHFKPWGPISRRISFIIHWVHHEDPEDTTRIVMPPIMGVIYGIPLFFLTRALVGPVFSEPFFAFFLVGYLVYDYTHWYVHARTPKTRFGKMVKQHHMLHHYVTQEARYGVSTPIWDYVFRTTGENAGRAAAKQSRPA